MDVIMKMKCPKCDGEATLINTLHKKIDIHIYKCNNWPKCPWGCFSPELKDLKDEY